MSCIPGITLTGTLILRNNYILSKPVTVALYIVVHIQYTHTNVSTEDWKNRLGAPETWSINSEPVFFFQIFTHNIQCWITEVL